jgi:hypothetical protein
MNDFLRILLVIACSSFAFAGDQTVQSTWAESDPRLDTNPTSSFWRGSHPIYMDADAHGKRDPKYRTEIRTRWTKQNLYFLFVCPYEELNLKPNPNTSAETNELWNWDVAEAFIGADFNDIRRYKEFEISPQGEWMISRSISPGRATRRVGSGIRTSRFLRESIRLLTCGMGR